VNKHRLKPKNPAVNKNTETIVGPASNKNQTPRPAGAKEAVGKAHICAQNHHVVVAMPRGNYKNTPNYHRNNTEHTQYNHLQTSKTLQTIRITLIVNHVGRETPSPPITQNNTQATAGAQKSPKQNLQIHHKTPIHEGSIFRELTHDPQHPTKTEPSKAAEPPSTRHRQPFDGGK
jgi:hypothetical protein